MLTNGFAKTEQAVLGAANRRKDAIQKTGTSVNGQGMVYCLSIVNLKTFHPRSFCLCASASLSTSLVECWHA